MVVKTRFAPSPTGFLHVGGLRTALYNYLYAKQNGGKFLLRVEDTDKARIVPGAEENIIATLREFGLNFDAGPYYQSKNLTRYKELADKLVSENKAYESEGAVRFRMPKGGATKFTDIIRGEIEIENKLQEDFVVLKSDGYPTYNLAHLVDDHDSGITHVIRGEEFISSMPKYVALHGALGWNLPQYAHLPLLLNTKKAKLSKREGDVAVKDFLEDGYLPEAILNFIALLGWHPKDEREIFSLGELVNIFKLEDVQKAGAVFDMTKLDWMNGEYIRKKSARELLEIIQKSKFKIQNDNEKFKNGNLEKIVALEQPRLKKLSEIGERVDFFFRTPEYDTELLCWKKMTDKDVVAALQRAKKIISNFQFPISKQEIEKIFLTEIGEDDKGNLLWPLRVALTGKKASPPPFEIMEILGKEETLARVDNALKLLK